MLILPIMLSYFIGKRILRILIPNSQNDFIYHFVSWGVGVGISSQLVFLSQILFNQYYPVVIVIGHIILLLVLYCIAVKSPVSIKDENSRRLLPTLWAFSIMGLFLVLSIPAALNKLFGDWDAWAFWNFRANFIYRSSTSWFNIFHFNLHGHQPWLLPFYIIYGWAFTGGERYLFPLLTAVVFSLSTIGLLFYGFFQQGSLRKAVFSGIFLCSIPFFIEHGVSQYADIVVGYYLLAALVLVNQQVENCVKRYFLAGFMLGCAAFTKDEGLVLSLLFLVAFFFYTPRGSWKAILVGFLTMMPAVIAVKLWMTGDPSGINKIYLPYLLDLNRWLIVFNFIFKYIFFTPRWGSAWVLLMGILWLNKKSLKGPLKGILCSIGIFLFIFIALYVVVLNNLHWRMDVSIDRLFFQITPLLTYTAFACI